MNNPAKIIGGLVAAVAIIFAAGARAQEVKHYRFAHGQQLNTGYSVAYDMFSARLKELSKGTMLIDQYPGAQLGQEPQLLQLVKSGDIEFAIISSANTATISPQAGVMSLHFLFRNADHVVKALADQKVIDANNALVFVSDKLWQSLSGEQKQWVTTAAAEISAKEPAKAFELEKTAATKLKSLGVKIVDDVDKKSFAAIADPYLDKLAKELGPHADKIKTLIRAVN